MQARKVAEQLLAIRSWERRNLPLANSLMAAEMLYLITSRNSDSPIRVKDLYLALGYSEARIRQILHALADDGWLMINRHGDDGRMRSLLPTERTLIVLLTALDEKLELVRPVNT